MISHFPFVWLLWKLFFVNVHFSSFFLLHQGIQEGKSVSKWKDLRTKDNLIKWKWHMLGVFTFFFNFNILLPKSLHTEFVCLYWPFIHFWSLLSKKSVLLTKSTPIHDKKFQQTRNRGEFHQLDKEICKKPRANMILNVEKLQAFPLRLGTRQDGPLTTPIQHHTRRTK